MVVGLWLGHLLFDSVFTVIVATIICIIFGTASHQFHGLGLFVSCSPFVTSMCLNFWDTQWVVLVLYGIVGALFAYCVSLLFVSPLAAFAAVSGYQLVMFMVSVKPSWSG
jgi:ATP-binding cassette subfamily A (ABC1) protein 3